MQPKSKQFRLNATECLRFTRYRVCGRSQLPAGQVLTSLLHFESSPSVRAKVGRPWRISWHPNQQDGSPVGEPPRGNQRLTTEVDPIACFRGLWEAESRLVRPSCSPTSILSFARPRQNNAHSQTTRHNTASPIESIILSRLFSYTNQFRFLWIIVDRSFDAVKNLFIKETNLRNEGVGLKC